MTWEDRKPVRWLSCEEAGEHRFNDEGQCIFCPTTKEES